ncbi:hypothetical protein BDV37DRAFT_278641 [Aspergillus pseudonomiae]|uniref:Uncharacterized protein n=1 Tax=Aspergillus pseudonomiae TaxID=1506151 RepID=A0A5N7DQB1_9EURO|nr:uncharacterized protein BDV37DRAFT_278641 [Aspergillus pseudonomiae]KAE8408632.1 hypothetical protein BDV37DRAFT_278641 [Aspergillus pseudonomiae]
MDKCAQYVIAAFRRIAATINASVAFEEVSLFQIISYSLVPLTAYLVLVSFLRFRRLRWLHKKYNYSGRESLARMTDTEAWEIQKILFELEFPFMFFQALQFALFKTYGIPTISKLLASTRQSSNPENALKRYADTGALLQEFMGNPPSSRRAYEAIARTRWIHSGYRAKGKILESDMLYTLGLFAIEPIRFIEKYEWRRLSDLEKCAIGTFWKSLGDGLGISYGALPSKDKWRDGLHWLEELSNWSSNYEIQHMRPHIKNREVADQATAIILYTLPQFAHSVAVKLTSFLMDVRLRKAMLYEPPSAAYTRIFDFLLSVRQFTIRHLLLPRPYFLRCTNYTEHTDTNGRIFNTQWGAAPYYVKPTVWNRWGAIAWLTWLRGGPLPGDEKYYPQGYYIPDVGPKYFEGKGREALATTIEELKVSRKGQCPFH